jgi:Fur family ferric uptake transcriptional regulator
MTDAQSLQDEVAEKLKEYLVANQLRQTRERYAILHAAYDIDGTFTIEDINNILLQNKFHVSNGTLYQTIQLLVQANLLIKHPFSSSAAIYERITDDKPRSYQICGNCHLITRIKSKELAASLDSYKPRTFAVSHRIVYVYGTCPKCQRRMRIQLRNNNKKK